MESGGKACEAEHSEGWLLDEALLPPLDDLVADLGCDVDAVTAAETAATAGPGVPLSRSTSATSSDTVYTGLHAGQLVIQGNTFGTQHLHPLQQAAVYNSQLAGQLLYQPQSETLPLEVEVLVARTGGQQPCSSCLTLLAIGTALAQKVCSTGRSPSSSTECKLQAAEMITNATSLCQRIISGSPTAEPCLMATLQQLAADSESECSWCIMPAKARSGGPGKKRGPNGHAWNVNWSCNTPELLQNSAQLHDLIMPELNAMTSSSDGSSSRGGSSGGSSTGGSDGIVGSSSGVVEDAAALYGIRTCDGPKVAYGIARLCPPVSAAPEGCASSGQSSAVAGVTRRNDLWANTITCQKDTHQLYRQELQLYKWAFVVYDHNKAAQQQLSGRRKTAKKS